MNFLFFLFLSIHRAQQPRSGWPLNVVYSGGSVVGKASIGPPPLLIFTWCQKVRNLASFSLHNSTLSRPHLKMQQDIRILKQKCNAAMIALCPREVWYSWAHAPLRKLCRLQARNQTYQKGGPLPVSSLPPFSSLPIFPPPILSPPLPSPPFRLEVGPLKAS